MYNPAVILSISERAAEKAARMAVMDPHGFTITMIAVAVVFSSLFLLYLAYSIVGWVCSGKLRAVCRRKKDNGDDAGSEVAAAITMALELTARDEKCHDRESYVITIRRKQ